MKFDHRKLSFREFYIPGLLFVRSGWRKNSDERNYAFDNEDNSFDDFVIYFVINFVLLAEINKISSIDKISFYISSKPVAFERSVDIVRKHDTRYSTSHTSTVIANTRGRFSNSILSETKRRMKKLCSIFFSYFSIRNHAMPARTHCTASSCNVSELRQRLSKLLHRSVSKPIIRTNRPFTSRARAPYLVQSIITHTYATYIFFTNASYERFCARTYANGVHTVSERDQFQNTKVYF